METSALDPVPPSLPGLTWRSITPDDLPALAQLSEACRRADGGLAFMNEPDCLKERYFPDAPVAVMGAFAAGGSPAACAAVHLVHAEKEETAVIVGQVRPDRRSQGIGAYLLRWSREQARALFTAGAGVRRLRIANEALTDAAIRLYHAAGFQAIFEELVLERDLTLPLPTIALPEDLTVRPWESDLAGKFFQAYDAAFRERPGFPGYSAERWISDYSEFAAFRPEWSLAAFTGDVQAAGFVTASARRAGGFVEQVGVVPGQRRRGIASGLIAASLLRMQAAGERSAQLTVNVNNPGAIQAYRQLGFMQVGRRARFEREIKE